MGWSINRSREGQGLVHPVPDRLLGPAVEAPPGRVPVAKALGRIPPQGAGPGDPDEGGDEEELSLAT
jgi:hypothetical protein